MRIKIAISNSVDSFIAWYRDIACVSPDWPVRNLYGQSVKINVGQSGKKWKTEYFNPDTGIRVFSRIIGSDGTMVTIRLPAFSDSIAFTLTLATDRELTAELAANGGFTNDTKNWNLDRRNSVRADTCVSGGVMTIDALSNLRDHSEYSDAKWDIALSQPGLSLLRGQTYTFGFKAWTDADKSISVTFTENGRDLNNDGNPRSWYGPTYTFALSKVPQTYTFTFNMQNPDDLDGLVVFGLADPAS